MFGYYLKLAKNSLKRHPAMVALMVSAIGLGIGACITILTVHQSMGANPIPHKSEQLFYVQLDNWDPNNPYDEPNEPPDQLTWQDANNLMNQGPDFKRTAQARSPFVIEPQDETQTAEQVVSRMAYRHFFSMFDVPFIYGGPWSEEADLNSEQVIVINREINDMFFGGEDSVGKQLVLSGRNFTVVGVIENWNPVPKFYDVTTGAFDEGERVFAPFSLIASLELDRSGNTNCFKSPDGDGFRAFLYSECVWTQFWVELENESQKQEYMDFLNAYAEQQKQLGRFERPLNNRLSDVMEWMENQQVVEDDAKVLLAISFMFLVVCLLTAIGLLLAKFAGKNSEVALRRAVGASKWDIFNQHLVETGIVGLGGGILGIFLAWLGLKGVETLFGEMLENLVSLNLSMIFAAVSLAVVSTILAGLYPTWRVSQVMPASQLKSQ